MRHYAALSSPRATRSGYRTNALGSTSTACLAVMTIVRIF